jgi:phosphoribosylaminoimidazole (AIR) synthetase
MLRTFNMGIGLIVACDDASADAVLAALAKAGEPHAARIGHVADGGQGVRYAAS